MTVIITGGTKGIGRALVEQFARAGATIFCCARTESDLKDLADFMNKKYPVTTIFTKVTDMSNREAVMDFANWILENTLNVDILINNAATFQQGAFLEESADSLESQMATNVFGAYHLTRALLPRMIAQSSGHIFNICSVASQRAYPNCGGYVVSKFALLGLTKVLRAELLEQGIKVTAVLPGATLTNSWAGVDLPDHRIMNPEDVAKTVFAATQLGDSATVEEIVMRPQLGDL